MRRLAPALLLPMVVLFGMSIASVGGAAAATSAPTAKTCPTDPYTHQTLPGCHGHKKTSLIIRYVKSPTGNDNLDQIDWQVCTYNPHAPAGAMAQLFLNSLKVTVPHGSGPIQANGTGCTTDPNIIGCLVPGIYTAQGTVPNWPPSNQVTFRVPNNVHCSNPVIPPVVSTGTGSVVGSAYTTSGGSSSSAGSSGGPLAFTGANILRAGLIGLAAILVGLVLTRVARERRRIRR